MARRNEVDLPGIRERPAHARLGFGAIALGLLAGAGLVAVAPWSGASTDSLASHPAVAQGPDAARVGEADQPAVARSIATKPRAWPRCPDCGVIESVRPPAEATGNRSIVPDRAGTHEVTVRFRDGSTMTFDAAAPRTWRVGSLVSVIGGPQATP
jgi:hypothetical protein